MPELRANQDDQLSSGSDAPEVDHAICAPEYRTDNTAPEVAPGRDAQVYYSTSPPEATEIDIPEPNDQLSATHEAPTSRSHKEFLIRIIVLAIIIGVSLSVGLSVGLKSRKDNAKSRKENTGQASNDTSAPPASVSNNSNVPKPVPKPGPHTLTDNTPIVAVTLPNNNRHLYFWEQTGAVRRAVFSSSAQSWHTTIDARILGNARNNTPIAVTSGFQAAEWAGYERSENLNNVIIYYVNSTDQLECVSWLQSGSVPCNISPWPLISVSPDTSHISAGLYDLDQNVLGLLLTYQNSSRDLVMMLGYADPGNSQWFWHNETEQLQVSPREEDKNCTSGKTTACSMQSGHILCLQENGLSSCKTYYEAAQVGDDFMFRCSTKLMSLRLDFKPADEALLALGTRTGLLRVHNSTLQSATLDVPSPKDTIPYNHIASTDSVNSSSIYVYYQLNHTTLVENLWDDTNGYWIFKNITIAT